MTTAVQAVGLGHSFGDKTVLDGLDLAVPAGTVCALLGPNGAGKTTTVRILTTLLRPRRGRATVAGVDVVADPAGVRRHIGLTGQATTVDDVLTGRENLVMWGRLFHLDRRTARRRADELLERFGLTEAADRRVKDYSGGMRRRLDIASSLVLAPRVFFLDEPTTGLDPRNRGEVWAALRGLVADGTTVLMTTQYLDEADQVADQVVVLDEGRKVAEGTPAGLKSLLGGDRLSVQVREAAELPAVADLLARVTGAEPEHDRAQLRVGAPVRDRVAALTAVVRALDDAMLAVDDISIRRPTLDEVFLHLTGRRTTEAETTPAETTQAETTGRTTGENPTAEEVPA
ncbi:ABC-2 type transport system ATP-binding protein [Pseudonocardia thermophila]|uniref:ABC-2 type transport system ATP-binding protein n=1 Tax=Pseudonocardia thermophila TaxID=1848 RepID=A0A1M6ZCS4_PSETH|nr:ATP-binding cassette domain-containing protein [Pseudonocardia thermophila]SHL28316.1 ABC-2 type transport system ATP-binding protein [Pseudonocardia thermophila]